MAFTEQEEEILRSLIQQSDPLLNLANSEENIMESLGAEKTSLSELPAGIDVLDEDLFLFRSGQVDQSDNAVRRGKFPRRMDYLRWQSFK